jgi:hypothetical protein
MLLALGLRNKDDDPAGMAVTTLMLIFVRNMLRALHKLPPSGNLELPNDPLAILASPRHSGGRRKPCPRGGERARLPACSVRLRSRPSNSRLYRTLSLLIWPGMRAVPARFASSAGVLHVPGPGRRARSARGEMPARASRKSAVSSPVRVSGLMAAAPCRIETIMERG